MNWNSVHICSPIQIKKSSQATADIDKNMIAVNKFFSHCFKEIDIKRYRADLQSIPTNNTTDVCQYSDAILKHIPKYLLKTFEKTLLCSKKKVLLPTGQDRRVNNPKAANAANRTDENVTDRIDKLRHLIRQKNIFTIPLKFLTNIGLVNHSIIFDKKIICTREADLSKLFESNKQVAAVTAPDAQMIWHDTPVIQYEQFLLNDNFRQFLETSILWKKVFCMEIQKTPLQNS